MKSNRSRLIKTIGLGAVLALGAASLTACGSSGNSSTSASSGVSDSGTGDSGAASGSLTYWSMWNETEPQGEVLKAAIGAFETQTGIKVDVKWVGRDVLTNVSAALTGGEVPDLVDQDGDELTATFGAADTAMGLQDVCDAKVTGEDLTVCGGAIPADYVKQYSTADGQPLMIPYELITSSFWFNVDKFPEIAKNPPKTWDDFVKILDQEKAAGRFPLALDGDEPEYDAYYWEWASVREAGPQAFFDAASDKTGAAWDNPGLLKAAQQLESLVKGGYFPSDFTGTKWPAQQTGWANGESKTDFLLMGSWAPSETEPFAEKNPEKWTYGSFPWPAGSNADGADATELYLIGFAIPKAAKNADNAKKFIEFFLNKDNLSGISTKALNLTPRADIAVPTQLEGVKAQIANASKYFKLYDGVSGAYPQLANESYFPAIAKLVTGGMAADAFIAEMKSATVDYWQSH